MWPKGSTPLTIASIRTKLTIQWPSITNLGITSLGKGFYKFSVSTLKHVQRVRVGFAFFVEIKYEKLPEFCNYCNVIGHWIEVCRKQTIPRDINKTKPKPNTAKTFVSVSKDIIVDETVILKIRNKAEEISGVLKETRIPHHVKHTSKDSEAHVKIPHNQTSEMTRNQDKYK